MESATREQQGLILVYKWSLLTWINDYTEVPQSPSKKQNLSSLQEQI